MYNACAFPSRIIFSSESFSMLKWLCTVLLSGRNNGKVRSRIFLLVVRDHYSLNTGYQWNQRSLNQCPWSSNILYPSVSIMYPGTSMIPWKTLIMIFSRHVTSLWLLPFCLFSSLIRSFSSKQKSLEQTIMQYLCWAVRDVDWQGRCRLSAMDTQSIACNYNETGSFPTASSIRNCAEMPQSGLFSLTLWHAPAEVTPEVGRLLRIPAVYAHVGDFHFKCPIVGR